MFNITQSKANMGGKMKYKQMTSTMIKNKVYAVNLDLVDNTYKVTEGTFKKETISSHGSYDQALQAMLRVARG